MLQKKNSLLGYHAWFLGLAKAPCDNVMLNLRLITPFHLFTETRDTRSIDDDGSMTFLPPSHGFRFWEYLSICQLIRTDVLQSVFN